MKKQISIHKIAIMIILRTGYKTTVIMQIMNARRNDYNDNPSITHTNWCSTGIEKNNNYDDYDNSMLTIKTNTITAISMFVHQFAFILIITITTTKNFAKSTTDNLQ